MSNTASTAKTVNIRYFAILKEEAGIAQEAFTTQADSLEGLYQELKQRFKLSLPSTSVRAAVNDTFVEMDSALEDGAQIVFVPPVAGG